jgi:hypothetical protein
MEIMENIIVLDEFIKHDESVKYQIRIEKVKVITRLDHKTKTRYYSELACLKVYEITKKKWYLFDTKEMIFERKTDFDRASIVDDLTTIARRAIIRYRGGELNDKATV